MLANHVAFTPLLANRMLSIVDISQSHPSFFSLLFCAGNWGCWGGSWREGMSDDSELFRGFSWGKKKRMFFIAYFVNRFFFFLICRNRSASSQRFVSYTCHAGYEIDNTQKKPHCSIMFSLVTSANIGIGPHRDSHILWYQCIISMTTLPMMPDVSQPAEEMTCDWRMVSA